MALLQVVNTEMSLAVPLSGTFEATFGQAALKLLEKGDDKGLVRLMELHRQSKEIVKELDKLVNRKK